MQMYQPTFTTIFHMKKNHLCGKNTLQKPFKPLKLLSTQLIFSTLQAQHNENQITDYGFSLPPTGYLLPLQLQANPVSFTAKSMQYRIDFGYCHRFMPTYLCIPGEKAAKVKRKTDRTSAQDHERSQQSLVPWKQI